MALAKVQQANGSNGTSQTMAVNYGAGPTSGNLLVACLGHDEASVEDQATITSAGWVRMATFEDASDPERRVHVFAKIAGASEPTAVNVDFGEVNRRGHLWVLEFSGFVGSLPSADAAASSGAWNSSTNSLQVAASVTINTDNAGIAFVFTMSTHGGITWDSGLTDLGDLNTNFRGSSVGWKEAGGAAQPAASIGSTEDATVIFVEVGSAPTPPPKPSATQLQVVQ